MIMNQRLFLKKLLCGLLALVLVSLTFLPATITKANNEYVQLSFYYPGNEQADSEAVEEKINVILREKIGAELSIYPLEWGTVEDKLNLMFASGDPMDLVFSAEWFNGYTNKADQGYYLEMSNLLNQYAPTLKKQISPTLLSGSAYRGKLFAIPNQNYGSSWTGVLFNEALVKKYKFDISKIKKLSDLEPMLKKIKEKEKNITLYMDE
jgi:putative aldouronate transport system substrate-binding protein